MNFNDAVTNMVSGRRLARMGWSGFYIAILSGQSYMWSIPSSGAKADVNATVYIPSVEDIFATDWMVKIN